jgi:hypothetical protein
VKSDAEKLLREQLVALLESSDAHLSLEDVLADWPGFYAEFFLNRSVPQA